MHFFSDSSKFIVKKNTFYKNYSRVPIWQRKRSAKRSSSNSNAIFNYFSNGKPTRGSNKRILCPDAPRNTTSFLIDDLEERKRRDLSPPSPSVSPTARTRCCSTSVMTPSDECPIAKLIPPKEDDGERTDEFYDMVNSLSWERLSGLSRDEVNRELIHIEEHNRDLVFHFTKLQQENDALRQLLKANGIDLPQVSS